MTLASGAISQSFPLDARESSRTGSASLVALHEVIQAVAGQTDVRSALARIVEKACILTHAATSAITLLDETHTLLDFAAVYGTDADDILGQTMRVDDALAGRTALTGELYLAHNPTESRPPPPGLDPTLAHGWGVRSAAIVPIYLASRPAGALAAINREDGQAFDGADLLCLQVLANVAALALNTDLLRRQTAQKEHERDILYEAARTASSSLNVQEVLRSVLATVAGTLEIAVGAVFLLNEERTRLSIGADRGLNDAQREVQLAADTGVAAGILSSGQPLLLSDTSLGEPPSGLPFPEMRTLLLAPMTARSMSEGLIVIGSRQAHAYSSTDARLLSAVASQAAVALENAWLYEDATRRAEEATAIYELSQAVGSTLQLSRVLQFVADSVLNLLHVDKFALFLYDAQASCLEIKVARNIRRETVQTMKPRSGEGIAGWVLEFETPTAVQDVAADHRNRSCPIDIEGVHSLVSVPLQSSDQVIGVIHAMSSRRRFFTVGEMELLYTIANQVGAAISNAQVYDAARQRSDDIRKNVRRVARALGSSSDVQQTAQMITELAVEMMQADRCVLFTVGEDGRLHPRAAVNFRAALTATEELTGHEPTAWVARRGRSLVIEDLKAETRHPLPPFLARERIAGYLGVPLKLGKTVLGVLELYSREPRQFTADEIRLLLTYASQSAVGLQNALLVEQANRRLSELQMLATLGEILASPLDTQSLLKRVLPLLAQAIHADYAQAQVFAVMSEPLVYWSEGGGHPGLDTQSSELWNALNSPEITSPLPATALFVPLTDDTGQKVGGLLLLRAKSAFDVFDRQLLTATANFLAARLRPKE